MTKLSLRIAAAGAALALVTGGCGGGGGTTAGAAPTKAEFIRNADAICVKADGKQKKDQIAFQKKYPEADSSKPWEEKIVLAAGLPPVQEEAEELGKLLAPSGDEARIQAIVEEMEKAVEKTEAQPNTLLSKTSAGPFTGVVKLAREYGFKACAAPL